MGVIFMISKNHMKRIISFLLITFISINTVVPSISYASDNIAVRDDFSFRSLDIDKENVVQQSSLEEFFEILLNTSDDFLENATEDELIDYFNSRAKGIEFQYKEDIDKNFNEGIVTYGWWENTKCGAAVILAVGGAFFIGKQLLNLKKYVAAIGGAKEAAYLVYLYIVERTIPDNLGTTVWNAVLNIATMILGIDEIKNQCGHLI